jgi:hypothetical protein
VTCTAPCTAPVPPCVLPPPLYPPAGVHTGAGVHRVSTLVRGDPPRSSLAYGFGHTILPP